MRVVLAIETGLRRSAIERLTLSTKNKSFVDIANNVLVSYESKTREYIFKYLGENAIRLLCNYISLLPDGSEKLFIDAWDGKTRSVFEKIRVKIGLPHLKFHNLRNLSVSYLADKGESAAVLQHHTRHKDFKTTQGYIGVNMETEKRISSTLDELFVDEFF
jgi:integrase